MITVGALGELQLASLSPLTRSDTVPVVSLREARVVSSAQRGDVDLDGGRIVICRSWKHPARKSGKAVVVQVHPHLDAILRPQLEGKEAGELVFPAPNGLMRDKYDDWTIREVGELAKVRRFRQPWHRFRHSHGTALGAAGHGLQVIQAALGQKTLEMARATRRSPRCRSRLL